MPKITSSSPVQIRRKASKHAQGSLKAGKSNRNTTFFEWIENWSDRNKNKTVWVAMILALLFGILLFDKRFSLAGDDSDYVIKASDFIRHFVYPGFEGPLYPVVLSPFVLLFGISPVPLKGLSLLFILGSIWFTYKAFIDRIPAFLVSAMLLLVSINSFLLYYASQTYSEAFFIFIQSLVFLVIFTFFIGREQKMTFREETRRHLILALSVLCLALTRSIGFAAIIAISGYFALKGQWKNLVFFMVSFAFVMAVFQGVKFMLWGNSGIHIAGHAESLLSRNYYRPDLGKENFHGFVNRLDTNSNLYISKYLYTVIGLREDNANFTFYPVLTALTYLMLFGSIILVFKKNKYLLFTGIYVTVFIAVTFLILQTIWGQIRMIIPYFPMILLMFLALFYFLSGLNSLHIIRVLLPVLVVVLFGLTFRTTISKVKEVQKISNRFYGLTPDWENYCKISEWAAGNLARDAIVACRKPSVSFIYGNGKRFFGIYQIKSFTSEEFLSFLNKSKTHPYFISSVSLNKKPIPIELYKRLSGGILAYGIKGYVYVQNIGFYVMEFPDSVKNETLTELNRLDIHLNDNIDSLKAVLNRPNAGYTIIYPDTLLNILMKARVTHVLTASLRLYSGQKSDQIISTVERFIDLIAHKYPKIITKIIQVGADDNEPAEIYRLNYDQYDLKYRD